MNSLRKAAELNLESISIPAISSGIFGFPKPLCAKIMARCTKEFIESNPNSSLKEIRLTNFDTPTVSLMEKEVTALYDSSVQDFQEEPEEQKSDEVDKYLKEANSQIINQTIEIEEAKSESEPAIAPEDSNSEFNAIVDRIVENALLISDQTEVDQKMEAPEPNDPESK